LDTVPVPKKSGVTTILQEAGAFSILIFRDAVACKLLVTRRIAIGRDYEKQAATVTDVFEARTCKAKPSQ
jgi:hypothetical protein